MREVIAEGIKHALEKHGLAEVPFSIEHPDNLTRGDYATNAAFVSAKHMKKSPGEVAELLAADLRDMAIPGVKEITVAMPGFINFALTQDVFSRGLQGAIADGQNWGRNNRHAGQKIMVEYTDPNPFKEMHIGHVMTNAIGESIARLLEYSGADVARANYQGDVGVHVAKAVYGMRKLNLNTASLDASSLGKAYALGSTAYETDEAAKAEIVALNKKIYERSDAEVNALYDAGRAVSLAYFEEVYAILGTTFAYYFFESEAAPRGKELVLAHPEVFPESDGARIFKGEEHGLHTRVFLNKEGLPTYEAKELELAKIKHDRYPYDHSIIVTANEINEYFKVLLKAMSFMYPDLASRTEHIGHGMLKLTTGKMSSRTGDVVSAISFIDSLRDMALEKMSEREIAEGEKRMIAQDVAVAAFKYAVLKGAIEQDVIFDPKEALSFEGASGPYLQYTAVRAGAVLAKAAEAGILSDTAHAPDAPYDIERIVRRFPDVVAHATEHRAPHHVASFLIELALAFNAFYANERIADVTDAHAPYKVALTHAVRTTLTNGLWLLGIKVPARM